MRLKKSVKTRRNDWSGMKISSNRNNLRYSFSHRYIHCFTVTGFMAAFTFSIVLGFISFNP